MAETLTAQSGVAELKAPLRREPTAQALQTVTLAVDNMHCGACMRAIEQLLGDMEGMETARANLSQRRVLVRTAPNVDPEALVSTLNKAGYAASLLADFSDTSQTDLTADLTRRLGVSGFAAMNVMLLSVSVWSGAGGDMEHSVQTLFHWLSALIAVPAIAYAGQPFLSSARTALASLRVNMDVPISLGVLLATGLSLYQASVGQTDVYFDAALMLLTFLLLGRLLDQLMRRKAVDAAENLLKLRQPSVVIVSDNGKPQRIPVGNVTPGMRVLVASGERLPVDGRIVEGESNIDQSIITGESVPVQVAHGDTVFAGAINLLKPIVVEVTAREDQSLLCEIAGLMATAQQQRGRYVRIADRAAGVYAPMVHVLAAVTFAGWLAAGASLQTALPIAIAVLIITCPCALALAVPAVQVAAAARLMKRGIILKSADALERLAECDTLVFDKTGTLTRGNLVLQEPETIDDTALVQAASLAARSLHPYSQAIVSAAQQRGLALRPLCDVTEVPGFGLKSADGDVTYRLGSASWCGLDASPTNDGVFFVRSEHAPVQFRFHDQVKDDAADVVDTLTSSGLAVELLSGDGRMSVETIAKQVGLVTYAGDVTPAQKVERLQTLRSRGRSVAMVGDGLNDAPSLATARVSLSPASATHIAQAAADFVFQGNKLEPVVLAQRVAKRANRLVQQNFALAVGYNILFVPLAMAGLVTPLIAAVAMSLSSISVTANALRLHTQKLELSS